MTARRSSFISINNCGGSERLARLWEGVTIVVTVVALAAALITSQMLPHSASTDRDMNRAELPTSLSDQDSFDRQRYLEESTTAQDTVASYRTVPGATYDDRLNGQGIRTVTANAGRECTHPVIGFPTCYTLQSDGTWAREELVDVDSGSVVVGTATDDEMKAVFDDVNGSAPYMEDFTPQRGQNR